MLRRTSQMGLLFTVLAWFALYLAAPAWAYDFVATLPMGTHVVAGGSFAPGYGVDSWQHDGSSAKSEFYLPVSLLFGHDVYVSNLASVSWWTNKPDANNNGNAGDDADWYLAIYTAPQGSGDEASWYRSRLNSEPYFAGDTVAPDTWHQWASNDSAHPLRFFDQPRWGDYGAYTDPTLDRIVVGPITWGNNNSWDYRSEKIAYFSFQTGSGWSSGFSGKLDGFEVKLSNGEVGRVNFEVVPEPSSLVVGCGLLALVFGLKRRQDRRQ